MGGAKAEREARMGDEAGRHVVNIASHRSKAARRMLASAGLVLIVVSHVVLDCPSRASRV